MKKLSITGLRLWLLVVAIAALLIGARVTEAVTCSPTELSPCVTAILSGMPPSSACCSKLREQKPCLCGYLRNPNLKPYVQSPNAKKVASACGVAFPSC
ncbi:non-specific lipid-transfer protein 2-like [Momordica charantia]|uniref:Non-specific lipid-transfer protein 2-like n=1 Tax=Momordica charantia TaxID=3673 RepID=A0A6J1D4R3_MOMCH|nr:non-specific lipid-transfer protein 2-like [Momordica charantia]